MEIEVKKSLTLEDGKHYGRITRVEYRDDPYKYTDIFIKERDSGFELKHGCPTTVSDKSKLGKLLGNFTDLKIGSMVDPEKILVDKEVQFVTVLDVSKDGSFARVVDGSLKPEVTEERV